MAYMPNVIAAATPDAAVNVTVPKMPSGSKGFVRASFCNHEGDQCRKRGDQTGDGLGAGPAPMRRLDEAKCESAKGECSEYLSFDVDGTPGRAPAVCDLNKRHRRSHQRDRHDDQEHGAPTVLPDDEAAERRADQPRKGVAARPDPDRLGAFSRVRIGIRQDRKRCRHRERGTQSAQCAAADQHEIVGCEPAHQRPGRKQPDAGDEQAAATVGVAKSSTSQQETCIGEIVGIDNPLQPTHARA